MKPHIKVIQRNGADIFVASSVATLEYNKRLYNGCVTVTMDELTKHVLNTDIEDLIMPMKCKFTTIIHSKGWTVWDACKYWGIRYDTYNRRCNNPKMKAQLLSMCRGLELKELVNE